MSKPVKDKKNHNWPAFLCNSFGMALILLVILLCLPLTVPRLLGYEIYGIVSGSMEPAIPVGSAVYAKQVSPREIAVGEVIVFYGGHDSATIITHRTVGNDQEDQELLTKGDANADNDMLPIAYHNVIGRVELSIPLIGYLLPFVSGTAGKIYLAGILGAGVLFQVLGGRLTERSDAEK